MSDAAPVHRRTIPESLSGPESALTLAIPFPWLGVISGCARDDARCKRALVNFAPDAGRTLLALAALLLDADERTRDAHASDAVHFIDRALDMRFFADARPIIRAGLADLDVRAAAFGATAGFSSLDRAQQLLVLRQVEPSVFVATTRELAIVACYREPATDGDARNVA
jgi:hypothetical protein